MIVYIHKRKDNNQIFYVGIGSRKYRANRKDRSQFWKNISSKYGYNIEIIHENLTRKEAIRIEKELIKKYGRLDLKTGILCNMTDGGEGKNWNQKRIDEQSKRFSGKNHPHYGKRGIEAPAFGMKHTEESKLLISKNSGRRGTTHTKRQKQAILKASCKKVIDNNTGIIYNSLKDASKQLNINYSTLRGYMNGTRKNKTQLEYI